MNPAMAQIQIVAAQKLSKRSHQQLHRFAAWLSRVKMPDQLG